MRHIRLLYTIRCGENGFDKRRATRYLITPIVPHSLSFGHVRPGCNGEVCANTPLRSGGAGTWGTCAEDGKRKYCIVEKRQRHFAIEKNSQKDSDPWSKCGQQDCCAGELQRHTLKSCFSIGWAKRKTRRQS